MTIVYAILSGCDIVYSRLFPESLLAFISSLITNIKTWFICSLLDILATGPTPRHIAFEMDGNRRYARRLGMQSKDGHAAGYEALYQVLEFCKRLRIHYVTVYAFAIENFNRPKEEVDSLMELMREKLIEIAEDLGKRGLRLNVLGRRELLPTAVQEAVEYAENLTRHNNVLVVNICAPYTSQDEITTAVESVIREAIDAGDFDGSTITENTINSHLSTSLVGSPPLDIFVRTSGVKRLSGFLLWQCCEHTQMHMVDACWPDFGPFHLLAILLDYQRKVWAEARR
ncbi:putative undecaprenyl diphosphate synthase domain containing protein [Tylopilus felleus]